MMEELAHNVFVHRVDAMGFPTASALVVTQARAFVVDTLTRPQDMDPVLAALAEHAGGRRRIVVNTHHHWDHVYGNAAFPTCDIVAQRTCPRLLEAQMRFVSESLPTPPREGVPSPTVTFGDRLTYMNDDESVHLVHTPGHSEDSIVVYLDQAEVLFAGDTLEWPLPTFAQRDGYAAWVRTLRQLKQLPVKMIVPSHGPAMGKELIEANERYLRGVFEAVTEQKSQGVRRDRLLVPAADVLGPDVRLDEVYADAHQANLEWAYDEV
jgi:glyoxylase-like metal-dependent hydrolase (beta-lactamase superfamily II)